MVVSCVCVQACLLQLALSAIQGLLWQLGNNADLKSWLSKLLAS